MKRTTGGRPPASSASCRPLPFPPPSLLRKATDMADPTFTISSLIPDSTDDALRWRLPPRAAEKFIAIRDAADAAAAAREQASDRRLELREEVARLRLELQAHAVPGRPESREAQGTRAAIQRRQQEMDRLERIADRHAAEVARNRDLLRDAYALLGDVPANRIRAVEVDLKLKRGETLTRISHTFCDTGAIWSERVSRCKSLTAAGQADPFRQSDFQPPAGRLMDIG